MASIRSPIRAATTARIPAPQVLIPRHFSSSVQQKQGQSSDQPSKDDENLAVKAQDAVASGKPKSTHKTVAEADAELMEKLAGHSDAGGAAGVEYENGKPVAQKRSVRNNMFRLI